LCIDAEICSDTFLMSTWDGSHDDGSWANDPNARPPAHVVRTQVEYYLSDKNLCRDRFFHERISSSEGGWLPMGLILGCPRMQSMGATEEDVFSALEESHLEIVKADEMSAVRRPMSAPLPKLVAPPITFRAEVFNSAQELRTRIQTILFHEPDPNCADPYMQKLGRVNNYVPVSKTDDFFLMISVFQAHPEVERKMFGGVAGLMIGPSEKDERTNCFWMSRPSGEYEDISYVKSWQKIRDEHFVNSDQPWISRPQIAPYLSHAKSMIQQGKGTGKGEGKKVQKEGVIFERAPLRPPAEGGQRFTGIITSFNIEKGFGFISCDATHSKYGKDTFLHKNQLHTFDVGDIVSFQVFAEPGKPDQVKAQDLQSATLHRDTGVGKGASKSAGKGAGKGFVSMQAIAGIPQQTNNIQSQPACYLDFRQPAENGRRFLGTIKSFSAEKGYGFISCDWSFSKYGKDVFLHKNQVDRFVTGDTVSFQLLLDPRKPDQPKAHDVQDKSQCSDDREQNAASEEAWRGTKRSWEDANSNSSHWEQNTWSEQAWKSKDSSWEDATSDSTFENTSAPGTSTHVDSRLKAKSDAPGTGTHVDSRLKAKSDASIGCASTIGKSHFNEEGTKKPRIETARSDPRTLLAQHGFPKNVDEWQKVQHIIFEGHPQLPNGWIRCWSKSKDKEYYFCLKDARTTFEWSVMLAS